MRYLESENPYIICRFTTGDTVTIDVYDLLDDSKVVDGVSMSEIGTTGYFKYYFNPDVSTLKEYLYIANNETEEHAGKIILGGYPDNIKDELEGLSLRVPSELSVEGYIKSDILAIDGSIDAAISLSKSASTIVQGQAVSGTLSNTQMSTDLTEETDSHYNGRILIFTSGNLKDQATDIKAYSGADKVLTYTATTEAPSAGDTFVIV